MIIIDGSKFSKIVLNQYKRKLLKEFINKNFKKRYYSAIVAIFKNEAHIIREWIEHYRSRGIQKIYLINDNSTDNFYAEIEDFIKYLIGGKDMTIDQKNKALMPLVKKLSPGLADILSSAIQKESSEYFIKLTEDIKRIKKLL